MRHVQDAAGADGDAGGVVEVVSAHTPPRHEALAPGHRVDADHRSVILVRRPHVRDDETAVGLDRKVVGPLEERTEWPVA